MVKKLHKLGWRVVAREAHRTDADDASSGVMVVARSHLGLTSQTFSAGEWSEAGSSRWLICTLRLRHVSLTIVPVYLHTGGQLNGDNLRLLADVGAHLSVAGVPAFVVGDWQVAQEVIEESGWLEPLGLVPVPMPGVSVTCTGVPTSRIDYALCSTVFLSACRFAGTVPVPRGTHAALSFDILATPRAIMVWKAMRPKPLPVKGIAAPVAPWAHFLVQARLLKHHRPAFFEANFPQAALLRLHHDNSDVSVALGNSLSCWVLALELEAFSKLGLSQEDVFQYVGRGQQPRLREVPLIAAQVEGPCLSDRAARMWQASFVQLKFLMKLVPSDSDPTLPPQPALAHAAQFRSTLTWLSQQVPPEPSDPRDAKQDGLFNLWSARFKNIASTPYDGLEDLLEELRQMADQSHREALKAQNASWQAWLKLPCIAAQARRTDCSARQSTLSLLTKLVSTARVLLLTRCWISKPPLGRPSGSSTALRALERR